MVTVARSVDDGFTPRSEVEYIQEKVITFIMEKLPHAELFEDYEGGKGIKRKRE